MQLFLCIYSFIRKIFVSLQICIYSADVNSRLFERSNEARSNLLFNSFAPLNFRDTCASIIPKTFQLSKEIQIENKSA